MKSKSNHQKAQHHLYKKPTNSSNTSGNNEKSNNKDLIVSKRPSAKPENEEQLENPNSGFSQYLSSGTGMEMMRMFVVANSLVLFVTIAWPNMKQSYQIVKEFFYGEETEI